MRFKTVFLTTICILSLLNCSKQKSIEIPLEQKEGYGSFHSTLVWMTPYTDDENNPWKNTFLNVQGIPENWTDVKYGDIETNIYQNVYQNYMLGNITKELFEGLKLAWTWNPDTLVYSKKPLKTKIAFAFGKDSTGVTKMIVDANNNLDLSDDECFMPYVIPTGMEINRDSAALQNVINVSFERYLDGKKVSETTPLFVAYMSQSNRFVFNFPQYLTANFDGVRLEVCSQDFTNLSYVNPRLGIIKNSLTDSDKVSSEDLISKNEFIEIKDNRYKFLGINQNKLVLEKINLAKDEITSSQVGYRAFSFIGNDFLTDSQIVSDELRGKYVYLDFWAVWCGPCLQEIPYLKELYNKTDRDKFEIIGIVGDSPLNRLQEIIKKDSITWPQIPSTETNRIIAEFGVQGYPSTFLLNPEGIIIAKDIRGKELEERILKLINN